MQIDKKHLDMPSNMQYNNLDMKSLAIEARRGFSAKPSQVNIRVEQKG